MCTRFVFFFFKQKTAYEMRISDWSSDVCSSDLNLIQEAIYLELSKRAPHNVIVVGDDDQAMYRFRGGSVECMVSFDDACKTFLGILPDLVKKYPLVGNFRSHPDIVKFCNDYLTAFQDRKSTRLNSSH